MIDTKSTSIIIISVTVIRTKYLLQLLIIITVVTWRHTK